MKKKQFNNTKLINHITRSSKYKIIFILSIFVAIYGSYILGADQKDFFTSILIAHSSKYFNILFFSLITINTINTCSIILNNYNYILRLKNNNKLQKELIKIVFKINIIWLANFLLLYFIFLNIYQFAYIYKKPFLSYNVTTMEYSIFYLIRYYLYALILQMINTIILFKLKEKKTLFIDFLFILGFYFIKNDQEIVLSFQKLPWFYYDIVNYQTFTLELVYSLIYLLLLVIGFIIIFHFSKKKLTLLKYFFYYDKNYIQKKQQKIILLLIFLPLLIALLKINDNKLGLVTLEKSLGLNIDKGNYDIISYLMYFFNIICFLLISIRSYISNYKTNLSQLYLRLDYKKFYIMKTYNILIVTFFIKLIQYSIILVILLLSNHFKGININILSLFTTDFLFIILLQQLLLIIYIIYNIVPKIKLPLFLGIILLILLIPKNIVSLEKYILILLFLIFILVVINKIINEKYHKKIIQEIGGV